jgi:hypothetical protein
MSAPAHAMCPVNAPDCGPPHKPPPPPPPPPPKPNGYLYPHYYLNTILYAPPGKGSEVAYGSGSTAGSKTDSQSSFKQGIALSATAGPVDISSKWQTGSISGSSIEIKQEQSNTLSLQSQADALDHGKDVFVLWMNPEIHIQGDSPTSLHYSLEVPAGQTMNIVTVTAEELQNPSLMSDWRKQALAVLTDADRANILAMDPFLGGNGLWGHPNRFVSLKQSIQIEGPDHPGDPIFAQSLELSSENTQGVTTGDSQTAEVEVTVGPSFSFFGLFEASLKVGGAWEWEYETTTESTTGTTQKAELKLESDSIGYYAVYDVYLDSTFNTFVFSPHVSKVPSPVLTGVATSATGQPLANQSITVHFADGSRRQVRTDAQGQYRLFDPPPEAIDFAR